MDDQSMGLKTLIWAPHVARNLTGEAMNSENASVAPRGSMGRRS